MIKRQNSTVVVVVVRILMGVVGWCDGAGYTSSAGASYNFDYSRARAYCVAVGAGGGGLDIFTLIYPFSSFSLSLGDGPI